MKNIIIILTIFCVALLYAKEDKMDINIRIGESDFTAKFIDDSLAHEVSSIFPLSIEMQEWAGNSEYYALLPKKINAAKMEPPKFFNAGDIALYNGVSLVIFYSKVSNTSGYVLLGHIENTDNLKKSLNQAKGKMNISNKENPSNMDKATLTTLYKDMYAAMIKKDMDELSRIHSDKFELIHMTGSKMNKTEYLAAVKDGTLNYYTAIHDDIDIKLDGNKASICGKSRVNAAVYGGGKHTWRLQQDMKAEKINGIWKLTHSKASTY